MHKMDFKPLPFLRGAHRQTLAGWLSARETVLSGTTVERIHLGEGDETTIHYHSPETARSTSPTLILVHGLEGDCNRPYMIRIARKAGQMGFRTARMNMRWCGDAEGLSSRFYNSTHSGDVRTVCEWLRTKNPESPLWVAGFSLGGNLTLKMAAEGGVEGLAGVVAVSPPIDLHLSARAVARKVNKAYHHYFVNSLVERAKKFLRKCGQSMTIPLSKKMTIMDFDQLFTVPLGGFSSLIDYYNQGSPKPLLHLIGCPALIIAAQDDPLVPFESFEGVNGAVRLLAPRHGGHLGFVGHRKEGDPDWRWAENRALEFLDRECRL